MLLFSTILLLISVVDDDDVGNDSSLGDGIGKSSTSSQYSGYNEGIIVLVVATSSDADAHGALGRNAFVHRRTLTPFSSRQLHVSLCILLISGVTSSSIT